MELVMRHRGPMRDEDGKAIAAADVPLRARAVEPGTGSRVTRRAGNGQRVQCTVYFWPAVDLTNDDELTVRGTRYKLDVGEWRSAHGTGRSGTEVLCTSGKG